MLDVQLFGMWPGGHHLVSALLHAAKAVLLSGLLRSMTGSFGSSSVAAALFAVHPLRVESVAWAAERKDVLGGFFWLLTMSAYVRYVRRPSGGRYLVVPLLFALGLMAKPMLVTLPLVVLILDWWPLGRVSAGASSRRPARLLREKAPLLGLAAASSAVTWYAQTTGHGSPAAPELAARVANAVVSYGIYLRQLFWPAGLAVLYPHPAGGRAAQLLVACAALILVVSVAAVRLTQQRPFLAAGWLWYVVTLLPVIGLVQVGWQAHADR
jgi:hypothetical protein